MFAIARTSLYAVAIVSSFFSFILAAAFVGRTNNDFGVYNEGSATVLAASLLVLLSLPVLHFLFHRRGSNSLIASVAVEIGVLFVLWAVMLGGAAAMSDQLLGLSYCNGSLCSLGRAVQAFAWISWIAITLLLSLVIVLAVVSLRQQGNEFIWTKPLETHSTKSAPTSVHPTSHTQLQPQPQAQASTVPPGQVAQTHPEMSAV